MSWLVSSSASGHSGIGHTRWATHGRPSEQNAHPHVDCGGVTAVIHNGIIENFGELKRELKAQGWTFATDTDTEVIANLISAELEKGPASNGSSARERDQMVSQLRQMSNTN